MKSTNEYATEAERCANAAPIDEGWMAKAQVYATLALAAATLEAACLMGPTPQEMAVLDALTAPQKCEAAWADNDADVLGSQKKSHPGTFHQCVYTAGHEHEEPHYCKCGSEMTSKTEDPNEADIDAFIGAIENPDADLCPGCGCTANVEHADGLVCEEYPGCSALMESPK